MFNLDDTLYEIIKKYPEALDFFIANGFEQLKNKQMLEVMGKNIKLRMALMSKKINQELFVEKLKMFLKKDADIDVSLDESKADENSDLIIEGVLPCPIRIPLLEGIKDWVNEQNEKNDYSISYNLKSANLGLDWVVEKVKTGNPDKVSDVLLSAGFELFFDKNLMGQYMENGIFETYIEDMNSDFCNENIDLRDPKKRYAISEEFEDSVALPMADLDLFNALLANLYKDFGMDGIHKLARSYKKSLHPAQMVKARTRTPEAPAVSIIPYFFSQMVNGTGDLEVVWPKDGALLSPIFMITKKSKADKIKPFMELFMSNEIGTIFSANGKFPSTNPNVDNHLEKYQNFKWIGWDFIYSHDIGKIIRECEEEFNNDVKKSLEQ